MAMRKQKYPDSPLPLCLLKHALRHSIMHLPSVHPGDPTATLCSIAAFSKAAPDDGGGAYFDSGFLLVKSPKGCRGSQENCWHLAAPLMYRNHSPERYHHSGVHLSEHENPGNSVEFTQGIAKDPTTGGGELDKTNPENQSAWFSQS